MKPKYLKMFRGATPPISAHAPDANDLPVDPYLLGAWLGDGSADAPSIASADDEILYSYMVKIAEDLNKKLPEGCAPHRATRVIVTAAGTWLPKFQCFTTKDCYSISIRTERGAGKNLNLFTEGLKELGLLNDKSPGIPEIYFTTSEDSRLALLAGLIDTDGCYVRSRGYYTIDQYTIGHQKIVEDARKLAETCGIAASPEKQRDMGHVNAKGEPSIETSTVLRKGSEKLQPFILLPRKKMDTNWQFLDKESRTVQEVKKINHVGVCKSIRVIGGRFQLHDGLVVSDGSAQ